MATLKEKQKKLQPSTMDVKNNYNKTTTYLLMSVAAVIWGFQPSCVKWIVQVWSPTTLIVIRYFFLCVILFTFIYSRKENRVYPHGKEWIFLALMGLCSITLNNEFQFTGLKYTTITNATLITAMTPAMTALMAAVFLRERLSLLGWLGIILSFAGTIIVISHGSLDVVININFSKGDIYCFLGQVAWGVYSLLGLITTQKISPITTTAWSAFFGTIFTAIYGFTTNTFEPTGLTVKPLLSLLYMIILGGVTAQTIWNTAVQRTGPSVASLLLNVAPVVGMFSGFFLFGETIGLVQLSGALIIFLGVFLTTQNELVAKYLAGWFNFDRPGI